MSYLTFIPTEIMKTTGSLMILGGIEVNQLTWIRLILEAKFGDDSLKHPFKILY